MTIHEAIAYFKSGEVGLAKFMGVGRVTINRVKNGSHPGDMLVKVLRNYGIEVPGPKAPAPPKT